MSLENPRPICVQQTPDECVRKRTAYEDGLWFSSITYFYGLVFLIKSPTAVGLIRLESWCIFIRWLVDHPPSPSGEQETGRRRSNVSLPDLQSTMWLAITGKFSGNWILGTGSVWRSWTQSAFFVIFCWYLPHFLCRGEVGQLSSHKREKARTKSMDDGKTQGSTHHKSLLVFDLASAVAGTFHLDVAGRMLIFKKVCAL